VKGAVESCEKRHEKTAQHRGLERTWGETGLEGICGIHGDDEGTITGGDLLRVVPLEVAGGTVPDIDSLPKRIVAGIKGTSRGGKLVGKDESIVVTVEARAGKGILRSIRVNEVGHIEEDGGLAGGIDTNIASDLCIYESVFVETQDGVCNEEGENTEEKEKKNADVEDAAPWKGMVVGMMWTMVVEEVIIIGGVELVLGGVIGIGDDAVLVGTRDS